VLFRSIPIETLGPLVIIVAFLAVTTDAYGVKKRFIPALFDGIGIGLSFSLLLCLLSSLRFALIAAIANWTPGNFLNAPEGVFVTAAVIMLATGFPMRRKKRGAS
jgi:Na+-translocating ferredoxin:NAD+ oxidoreductase RnfE subunit